MYELLIVESEVERLSHTLQDWYDILSGALAVDGATLSKDGVQIADWLNGLLVTNEGYDL